MHFSLGKKVDPEFPNVDPKSPNVHRTVFFDVFEHLDFKNAVFLEKRWIQNSQMWGQKVGAKEMCIRKWNNM